MDEDFCAQLGQDKQTELVRRFRELTLNFRTVTSNQWFTLNPRTIIHRWWLSRRIDTILSDHIRAKFAELKAQSAAGAKSRSVLSLSLQDLDRLDNRIVAQTRDQLKSFLFAGHDTTSILLQWAFYELSRTPRALAAIRAELDDIFGADSSPAVVRDMLLSSQREGLVRRMSYTSAVIKETLRLYPPSGSARHLPYGSGFTVALPGGGSLCLDGTVIYNCSTVIQRDEGVYGPTAAEFRPERWLGDTDTSMQTNVDAKEDAGRIPASAWRPFERGPRNCIGQELANLEARVILACTVRRYDFEKVGLGAITHDSTGLPVVASNGQYEVKKEVFNVSIPRQLL
jgi:cytochrome P450